MPVMVTEAINLDEELANMKATLERFSKESAKKDAQIKHQNKQIADLTKKLEKQSSGSFNKGLSNEYSNKESNHIEESDDGCKENKDHSLELMSVKLIQNLITDAVKAHLGGNSHKIHLCKKPYAKRIDALHVPDGYQPPKLNQFDGKSNPKQHIAHFIKTSNNAGTEGNRLVKQFV